MSTYLYIAFGVILVASIGAFIWFGARDPKFSDKPESERFDGE